ncbi:MAG: DUF3299 domain-containing protein [Alphaproteobacteria bacterium]|nr:DUF3299 domain-containing protein [Alphaproteobacteria bacterium]
MSRPRVAVIASAMLIATALAASLSAQAGTARELKWADLVPKTEATAKRQLKTFFAPRGKDPSTSASPYLESYDLTTRPEDRAGAPPPRMPEAKWMSRRAHSNTTKAPELKTDLDGETVKIGGYVVPLDFKATKVTEFLLVPFVGACIHVPPPPANQIIYVKADNGFTVKGEFDPVYVTGKLSAKITATGLAETGYTIKADAVEMRAK